MLQKELEVLGVVHHAQPGVISITQSTEYGTLYSVEELKELIDICKGSGLRVHMDGARIANATAALGLSVAEFTCDLGVDILSFGEQKTAWPTGKQYCFQRRISNRSRIYSKTVGATPIKNAVHISTVLSDARE